MKLVFIYGPPASGKLTVAKELAKLIGFKLFDNHVSIRFLQSLFEFGSKPYFRLIEKYRLEMIEEAAKEGIDFIFTFVYETKTDDLFIKGVLRRVNRYKGQVFFVRLQCDVKELQRRVTSRARKSVGKVATKTLLNSIIRKYNLGREVPFQTSLTIDTTHQSPKKTAKTIARFYHLLVSKKSQGRS